MTTKPLQCAICQEFVELGKADQHLRDAHPTPVGGFLFFHDAVPYRTEHPSMLVSDLLKIIGGIDCLYDFHEERDGKKYHFSREQSVDLTNGPRRFYSVPPATMWGGSR